MPISRVNETRLAAVFEAAVDGIIIIDPKGTIQAVNPAVERMFGWAAGDLLCRRVNVLMPTPYREEHDGYLERYAKTGEKRIIGVGRKVAAMRRDGSTFPIWLSVAEIDEDGQRMFAAVLRDISELEAAHEAREQLIEELEAKNAELERFTYTVSHDLKSPLITIKGFVGQLEKSVAAGKMDRFRSDVARIAGAADKLKALLDDVLELSRIGRVVNPPEDVALQDVAAEAIELLGGAIADRAADVTIEPDLPVVRADRVRLREVLQNLVENALKFSRDTPRIQIGARIEEGFAVCWVLDHGIGIDPLYVSRIFGLFEQIDADAQGTGVGLALVRRIAEVHGGKAWAESDGLGHGARMHFTIPLASHPPGTGGGRLDSTATDG
jgi:two-component system sensor kinase FixL